MSGEHANAASVSGELMGFGIFGVLAGFGPLLSLPLLWPVVVPLVEGLILAMALGAPAPGILGDFGL